MEVVHYKRLSLTGRVIRAVVRRKNRKKKFIPDISLEQKRIQSIVTTARFQKLNRVTLEGVDDKDFKAIRYTPHNAPPSKRLIMYLHGGGFCWGSVQTHGGLAIHMAQASQLPVFSVGYRLAPEHPFPAALNDAHAAYRHLIQQGHSPQDIILAGDSAGAALAVGLYYELRDKYKNSKQGIPQKCICLYPWLNILDNDEDRYVRGEQDPVLNIQEIDILAHYYLNGKAPFEGQGPEREKKRPCYLPLHDYIPGVKLPPLRKPRREPPGKASPLYGDPSGLGSFLIQTGTSDILFSDAVRFAAKAHSAGVKVRIETYRGMLHGWHYLGSGLPEARRALQNIAAYVNS